MSYENNVVKYKTVVELNWYNAVHCASCFVCCVLHRIYNTLPCAFCLCFCIVGYCRVFAYIGRYFNELYCLVLRVNVVVCGVVY